MITHFELEQRNPTWAEHERQLDAGRRARNLPSLRQFPCLGRMEITGEHGDRQCLCCSACFFEVSVPIERVAERSNW